MDSHPLTPSLFSDEIIKYHLGLLDSHTGQSEKQSQIDEAALAPIIASSALRRIQENDHSRSGANTGESAAGTTSLQYGLLAGSKQEIHSVQIQQTVSSSNAGSDGGSSTATLAPTSIDADTDPRLLFNISAPSSTFICGSQGSGKSHTLSCMLESCLIPSKLGRLTSPLTGVVFHYDTFISDACGSPCEAAYLASNGSVKVKVLCAPTNAAAIKKTYQHLNVTVEPLAIDQSHLNTKRMMDLMAVNSDDVPLYMESVKRILREMRMVQQNVDGGFDYADFKKRVNGCGLTPAQMGPLQQRLETLESFMPGSQTNIWGVGRSNAEARKGTDWRPVPGQLTIVDLSCPCVSPETACGLFNICLGIFLQQDANVGRVFALDEAHKYMNASPEATVFTETILSAVRLQRHLGVRIIVSTQEPTISTALLNLCSVTIVHRFTSPEWLRALRHHLAAAAEEHGTSRKNRAISTNGSGEAGSQEDGRRTGTLFDQIVRLKVGEALLFAPSAVVGVYKEQDRGLALERLGDDYLAIRVRGRLTEDGGRSVLSL
ncbi:uncharacterized protein DSM5745_09207 [Aspergillus mulundensis]|uniref:Zona occludens toxin N-terminal domain-containing protein n=1 Tax=Aspergillus mulundensis TaxID=1810919 RepID=A0A3D8R0A4_9EURO|nr:Uncharacterized protein DSM5745_09207 [Aspergillus mulundensis]RDW67341.1 Uncharacterized protein DSM5745_09207 [Aspergillus mulundensis]